MNERPTTEQFGAQIRVMATALGQAFTEPDDDWQPVLFAMDEEDVALISGEFGNEQEKTAFFETIPSILSDRTVLKVAFLSSAWGAYYERSESGGVPEGAPMPSESPNRKELLILMLGDCEGKMELWTAEIYRDDEQPPALQEWEQQDTVIHDGRVARMMREVMK